MADFSNQILIRDSLEGLYISTKFHTGFCSSQCLHQPWAIVEDSFPYSGTEPKINKASCLTMQSYLHSSNIVLLMKVITLIF